MRLKHSDWRPLLNAISELNSDSDPATLAGRAIKTANSLVSGEITAFDFFDDQGVHTGEWWYDPPNAVSASEFEIFANVAHEHPFTPAVFGNGRRDSMTISDLLTTPEFHRTAIYNEFFRLYGVDHQLLVPLQIAHDQIATYTYNRVRSDFTNEERLIVNLWLQAATNNLNTVLADKSVGVASFDHSTKLRYLSDFGQILLDRYYGRDELRDDGVPNRLADWVANCDAQRKADPMISEFKLKLEKNGATLCLTVIFDDAKQEKMVLLEEHRRPSPVVLYSLGLTQRQSEILFWVSQGKTDKDIAALLAISPRTVQKHLENVYVKLGVETRTAAMSIAAGQY
ncbi:MAG: LuxR C-terminal-related transcriptional regulator [Pyrinomonadaceae bacterium]